jgi:Flp pilus assembly protein TadG
MTTADTFPRPPRQQRRGLRRFLRNAAGSSAIEFAILAVPFLAGLIGAFEVAVYLFTEDALQHNLEDGARQIRTGAAQNGDVSAAEFKAAVCGNLSYYLDCDNLKVEVKSFEVFGDVAMDEPIQDGAMNPALNSPTYDPGQPEEVVVARAFYQWNLYVPSLVGFSNLEGGKRLVVAAIAFRNEPYTEE